MTDSLAAIASDGDHPATLRALRDRLAAEIDAADSARDVAVLSARLVDVLTALESVKVPEKSVKDELAKKRNARRSAVGGADTPDSAGSSEGEQRSRGGD